MVKTMASSAKDVSGIVSLDYKLKGDFDQNMTPIYPSLEGGGTVNLKDVAVKNLKMLSIVGDNTGVKGFNNPDMQGVNIVTHIQDNLIHVDKFTFKVSILRPSISGTTSFNGLLDILVRVGLPPAGIIGIPVSVTGTGEKPKLKFFSRKGQAILTAIYNRKIDKVVRDEKPDTTDSRKVQRKLKKTELKNAKVAEKKVDKEVKQN